jgi:glucosamine kinase
VGGWGFALSDDGSGALLGRAAIRAAMLAIEGLAPKSELTAAIMAQFGRDPATAVVWARTATPRDYGSFAPLVFEHAGRGDTVAGALVAASAAALATMLDRLIELGATRIALMGGLAGPHQPHLPERFAPLLVAPRGDAMDGAIALARRSAAG